MRSWMNKAECRDRDEFCSLDEAVQVSICAACPVTRECLAYAIDTRAVGVVMAGIAMGDRPLKA